LCEVAHTALPCPKNCAAHRAACDLADRLGPLFQASSDDIVFSDGKVLVRDKPDTAIPFKNAVREAKIGAISHRAKRPDDYEGHVVSVTFGLQVSRHGIGGVQFRAGCRRHRDGRGTLDDGDCHRKPVEPVNLAPLSWNPIPEERRPQAYTSGTYG
jgi:hypothetical protein